MPGELQGLRRRSARVAAVLGVAAWIGYTLITEPLPQHLDTSLDESEVEAESEG